jgi:hypothetical protein
MTSAMRRRHISIAASMSITVTTLSDVYPSTSDKIKKSCSDEGFWREERQLSNLVQNASVKGPPAVSQRLLAAPSKCRLRQFAAERFFVINP